MKDDLQGDSRYVELLSHYRPSAREGIRSPRKSGKLPSIDLGSWNGSGGQQQNSSANSDPSYLQYAKRK
jgi:hypothetical protein